MIGKHVYRKAMCKALGASHVIDFNDLKNIILQVDICIFASKADQALKMWIYLNQIVLFFLKLE